MVERQRIEGGEVHELKHFHLALLGARLVLDAVELVFLDDRVFIVLDLVASHDLVVGNFDVFLRAELLVVDGRAVLAVHQAEGKSSAVVPINDLYDEFNFGERTPVAIKQFLQTAQQNWKTPPTYLLLNGRASLDPRNYLGLGNLDLVPTRIVAGFNVSD